MQLITMVSQLIVIYLPAHRQLHYCLFVNEEPQPHEKAPQDKSLRLHSFPKNTRETHTTSPHRTQQSVAGRLDFSASRPPPNRPASNPPSQQGKRMIVTVAYTPLEQYCCGPVDRNDATEIGWSLIHFSTNSYVESFPPSRGIKEVGGGC